jgi:CRISPR-associated protein Csd1
MLHEIVNYARRTGLCTEPGFASKEVHWAISLTSAGRYGGLLSLGDPADRRQRGRMFPMCPDLSQGELIAGGQTRSHFLVETVEVLAGFGQPAKPEKTAAKRRFFIELLKQASEVMPELSAAAAVLEDQTAMSRLREELVEAKARPTDKITLYIDGRFPVESEDWHEWWRRYRAGLVPARRGKKTKDSGKRMLCLLTGEAVFPARTHPKIKGLSGANPVGAVLVGFDKEAFCSFGLEQSANAAMSEEAAKAYEAGLNELIRTSATRLGGLPVLIVHWYRSKVESEDDPLAWLEDPPEVAEADAQIRARELLTAIQTGRRPDLADNTYYALSLSGNGGRVMVRDWMEGAFEQLVEAVHSWFADLAIVQPSGGRLAPLPRFSRLVSSLAVGDQQEGVTPPLAAKLYHAAVRGETIPAAVMARALARTRVDFVQGNAPDAGRMGLLRAYLVRHYRQKGEMNMAEAIQPELNKDLGDPAYQCGRLMAVLAAVQREALGDVGADVIQRYYAAASATPALVFGRLIRLAQFHLAKVKQDKPGLGWWYEDLVADISKRIGREMPATLTLEQQTMFALGYYHQLAELRAPRQQKQLNEEGGNQ